AAFAGAPVAAVAGQTAPVAQQGTGAESALSPQPEMPMRAVMLGAVALVCLPLFACVYPVGRMYDTASQLHHLCDMLLLAVGGYLLMKEMMYKVIGGGLLLVGSILQVFTGQYLNVFGRTYQRPYLGEVFGDPWILRNIGTGILSALIVGGVFVLVSLLYKAGRKKQVLLAGLLSSGALAVQFLFNLRTLFIIPDMPGTQKLLFVLNSLLGAASIVVFAILVLFLCSVRFKRVDTGVGARVWLGICIFASIASTIGLIVTGQSNVPVAVIALVWAAGYLMVFCKQRIGFPIALIALSMSVLANIKMGLVGYNASPITVLTALLGVLNPVITWLLLRKSWMQPAMQPVAPGVQTQRFSPPPSSAGYPPTQPLLRQMYSYIATTGFLIDPESEKGKVYANQIHPFACRQMRQLSPLFAQKYEEATKRGLPHTIGFGTSATKEGLNQSFKSWVTREGIFTGDLNACLNKTLFMKQGQVPDPVTGQDRDWTVYVYFMEE
ncbi:hypothetical protein LJC49_10635, partial [Ruminococcaceae bacterium OttesenSCG-928-I18]|nr:hypothetical protein [Ruminococcaceae bacterium OttesenSCG-928-I18]